MKKSISLKDSALVVVDMLYDFIDGSLACLNAEQAVAHTLDFIKNAVGADVGNNTATGKNAAARTEKSVGTSCAANGANATAGVGVAKGTKTAGGNNMEITGTYPLLFVLDHHPSDHCSFTENGGIWPAHCVEGTRGAEIHDSLKPYVCEELCFFKGCDKTCEQYSGAEGQNDSGQTLSEVLELLDITNVYVCGIATEYCVRNTCMDLLKAGFKVSLLEDCLAYVDAEGHAKTVEEMALAGIYIISSLS